MTSKAALVVRATGSQGSAVVKHLATNGWNVHALVSEASSDRAVALRRFGDRVFLYEGSLSNVASIEDAIRGCSALFLTQMPSWTDNSETREATTLLDIAKKAGMKHVVVSTQLGLSHPDVERIFRLPTLAPAVTGKIAVEKIVRGSGMPWTVIRPGWFDTNITLPLVNTMYPGLSEGKFVNSYAPDLRIATVDPDDIGAFVAHIFSHPDKYSGHCVDIASQELTVAEIIAEIERASGRRLDVHYRTAEENEKEMDNPFVVGQLCMKPLEGLADMEKIRGHGVPLTSFRRFLENNKETVVPR